MDQHPETEKFEATFTNYMQTVKSLGVGFGKENPALGSFMTSVSKDPETNLLLSSLAHQISENDLKVEQIIDSFYKKFFLNGYPELTSQVPQYCMIKVEPDYTCYEHNSPKFVSTDDVFSQQIPYGPLLKFKSMISKQVYFHKIVNASYFEPEKSDASKFFYFDKLTPLETDVFSYFKISLEMHEYDEKNINVYVHSKLENSLQILGEIAQGHNRFFLVAKDKITQKTKNILINPKHIHIPFEFEHYLGKSMNEIYGLFDFSNFIYKYFYFNIDLTSYKFFGNFIDIIMETKLPKISRLFKKDLYQLNVFPVINVYSENNHAYKIKQEKTTIVIKNSENSQNNFLGINSVDLFNKDKLTHNKIFSLQEIQTKKITQPQDYGYEVKGWDACNNYFSINIIKLNQTALIPKNLYVLVKCLYTNGIYVDLFSSKERIDTDLNYIKHCSVVFVAQDFRSPDSLIINTCKNISFLNHIKSLNILSKSNWLSILTKTLDVLCFNDVNKRLIINAVGKVICNVHLEEDQYKSLSLRYNIKSLKSHQNSFGIYFILEFLKNYLLTFKDINLKIDFGSNI